MSNYRKNSSAQFKEKWGEVATLSGFTQLPNILLRGTAHLKLTPHESLVLFYILSVGNGYAPAKEIASNLGIYVGTVRKVFRSLEKKNLIRRIQFIGEANRFDVTGVYKKVKDIAVETQRADYVRNREVSLSSHSPVSKKDSNKDVLNTKNIKKVGYKKFLNEGKKAKERAKGSKDGL